MLLVSILGDFHSSIVPVSYAFRKKITKHIIVYDDSHGDKQEAARIIRGQKAFLEENGEVNYELIPMVIDEDSYTSLLGCVEKIKQYANSYDEIYLNATDGLSSVVLVLSTQLMPLGAKVIAYDRYANTYNLHTSETMEKFRIKESMDVRTHLIMKGYSILEASDKRALEWRKAHIMALTKDLVRYKSFADRMGKEGYDNVQGYDDYKSHIEAMDDSRQHFIQGTVFEEYIYHLIKDNFEFDDVCTGVKVRFEEGVENEFDILMIKDNHLHTIECKLVSGLNGEHYVYKTELIKEYLDDDGRAMILSVGADNVRRTKSGNKRIQFTRGDRARARYGEIDIHQVKVFDEAVFLRDVEDWFFY